MFQSRWGFHPCDYATYRKLKFLHHLYLKAVRSAHAWERWRRKDPHNRVVRRRIRNAKGQTIGYERPTPREEPSICPIFSQKVFEKRHVDKRGRLFRDGFLHEKIVIDDLGIVADYASARKPVGSTAEVRPLRLAADTIDSLCAEAQRWLEEGEVK